MKLSKRECKLLMKVKFEDMNEDEFALFFDIYHALTDEDGKPKDCKNSELVMTALRETHPELVQHLASELQI